MARYLLAESHRQSAKFPRKTLSVEQTRARRTTLLQEMRKQLQAAAESHRQLRDMLNAKQEHHELSSVESAVLRNAHFACGDALFDLNEYDQAIEAYSAAIDRYQTEPESLEALLQIANCYRRLNVPSEARGTLMQAQAALTRMREDADFKKATRYDRDGWAQLIGWLCQT
jgi:TolA-binding protein